MAKEKVHKLVIKGGDGWQNTTVKLDGKVIPVSKVEILVEAGATNTAVLTFPDIETIVDVDIKGDKLTKE